MFFKRLYVKYLTAVVMTSVIVAAANAKDYAVTPVDFAQVKLQFGFWKSRVDTARKVTIPFVFERCEYSGRIKNFIFASGAKQGKFSSLAGFDDSDVYKVVEGASYSLALHKNDELDAYLDELIGYFAGSQEDTGYLYTAWTLKANDNTNIYCSYDKKGRLVGIMTGSHELYNMGHLYEAAVAHYMATGKRSLLDVAIKNADYFYDAYMVQGTKYPPSHQEIEIGLVKLFRVTKDKRYLELAKFFLDIRGTGGKYCNSTMGDQTHKPVTMQEEAVGHAVRANYMYTAMADIAALTGDKAYLNALDKLWNNVVGTKLSIIGGVGAHHRSKKYGGEAYCGNYDLPNKPYNETCAAIANVYWNHRMFLLHDDSKYIDVIERIIYNGVLSGISLDGTRFFYSNTLQHDGNNWVCLCCKGKRRICEPVYEQPG